MLDRPRVVHKGDQPVADRRMPGIAGLGGQTEIARPQSGDGEIDERLARPGLGPGNAIILEEGQIAGDKHQEEET